MPRDDRERNFEKALAHNLRADARPCPEAETLAAYHERLLAPEQMISWKEHIAACSRCQQILAHLEFTDELLVEAYQEEGATPNVVTMAAPAAHAASGVPRLAAGEKSSRQIPQPRRAAHWRWLAPAGALAASLLVWVAIHERNPGPMELAKNERQASVQPLPETVKPAPPSSPASPQSSSGDELSNSKAPLGTAKPALSDARRDKDASMQLSPGVLDRKSTASPQAKNRELDRSRDLPEKDSGMLYDGLAKEPKLKGRAQTAANELQEERAPSRAPAAPAKTKTDAAASSPAPPPSANVVAEAMAAVEVPSSEARAEKKAAAGVAGLRAPKQEQQQLQQQVVGGMLTTRESAVVRAVGSKVGSTISSPVPHSAVIWRIGSAGIIERSTDSGSTWTLQPSGVVTDLLAGSATSDEVCWIVGRAGTILRTTDGGKHWRKLRSPVQDELASVFAVDAQQAVVSPAQGSYQTTDGGLTWNKLAPE